MNGGGAHAPESGQLVPNGIEMDRYEAFISDKNTFICTFLWYEK